MRIRQLRSKHATGEQWALRPPCPDLCGYETYAQVKSKQTQPFNSIEPPLAPRTIPHRYLSILILSQVEVKHKHKLLFNYQSQWTPSHRSHSPSQSYLLRISLSLPHRTWAHNVASPSWSTQTVLAMTTAASVPSPEQS